MYDVDDKEAQVTLGQSSFTSAWVTFHSVKPQTTLTQLVALL
jgi:hypothetical protein